MKKMNGKIFIVGSPLISLLLTISILLTGLIILTTIPSDLPGEAMEVIPAQKIQLGEKHPAYNSNPPTSGWHSDSRLRDGIFTEPVRDEQIVEALIKGAVVINYNCLHKSSPAQLVTPSSRLTNFTSSSGRQQSPEEIQAIIKQIKQQNKECGDIVMQLRRIVEKKGAKNIILAPNPKLDARVALASWGRLEKMLWVDDNRIIKFIDVFRGRKPKI